MKKQKIKTHLTTPKLMLSITIASLLIMPNALMANTTNYGNLGIKLVPFKIKESTSVYQIATQSNLTIEQLNNLNRNQIRGRNKLSAGETIFVPSDSKLVKVEGSEFAKVNQAPVSNTGITPAPVVNQIEEIGLNPNNNPTIAQNNAESADLSSLDGLSVDELMTESNDPEVAKAEPIALQPIETAKTNAPVQNTIPEISAEPAKAPTTSQPLQATANTLDLGLVPASPEPIQAAAVNEPVILAQTSQPPQQAPKVETVQTPIVAAEPMQIQAAPTDESGALQQAVGQSISSQIESALTNFGTARASVNLDEKAKFKSLNFNVLGNLIETEDGLFFAQLGVNNQGEGVENRTVGNAGIGYRHDFDAIRAGANVFIDQDFSNNNTRMSVGGELAADYMNFSSNFYAPISGWKQSDIVDTRTGQSLKERAAKGYDINANMYLPQHPQLGGGIMFEQYFGDDVGLFSEDERQRNPSAFGASIHYTPIPLVTAKAAHKIGNSGKNDTTLNVDVNLQLGRPLSEQVDPANVAELRTLKGSKYDIVNRNYAIVYEYEAQSGQVVIAGPRTAKVNEVVQIQPTLSEGIMARSYVWHVTSPTANQEYSGEVLNLPLSQEGEYQIQLAVLTENNDTKLSNQLEILTDYEQNETAVLAFAKSSALASVELDNSPFVSTVDANHKLVLALDLPKAASGSHPAMPSIMWKSVKGTQCANWCDLTDEATGMIKSEMLKIDEDSWAIHIIGSEAILGEPLLFKSMVQINGVEYTAKTTDSGQFN